MPNPNIVPITQPRVPFLNPETGFVSMPWYLFLLSLSQSQGGSSISLDDVQKGPPSLTVDEVNAIIDKAAGSITPSQDGLLAQIAELQKQVTDLAQQPVGLLDQVAELQKQVEALQLTPALAFGTMAFENVGISGTAALAKLTALGANGSLTFANGIITAYVAPT